MITVSTFMITVSTFVKSYKQKYTVIFRKYLALAQA